jgi:hypothetical protein
MVTAVSTGVTTRSSTASGGWLVVDTLPAATQAAASLNATTAGILSSIAAAAASARLCIETPAGMLLMSRE